MCKPQVAHGTCYKGAFITSLMTERGWPTPTVRIKIRTSATQQLSNRSPSQSSQISCRFHTAFHASLFWHSGQRLRTCMSKARAVCGCASLFSERVSQSGQAFYSMWSFFFNLFSKCSLNKTQLVWKCYIKSLVSLSFFVLFDLYLDHHWYPTATELGAALPPGCIHIPP